ncbi:MAG: hypothetical protein NT135_00145 [Candidatus Berkelbacteria bacterium]|nr:hypothetical protein [Candidatus Berkelbacteria bacterium]
MPLTNLQLRQKPQNRNLRPAPKAPQNNKQLPLNSPTKRQNDYIILSAALTAMVPAAHAAATLIAAMMPRVGHITKLFAKKGAGALTLKATLFG